MRRRFGLYCAALTAMPLFVLVASGPAGASLTGGEPLGTPFQYGEFAAGSSSVFGETVGGAAAYGGDATITSSTAGVSPDSTSAPGGVTMDLGANAHFVNAPTLGHGRGAYLGTYSGWGDPGRFSHVPSLPIGFPGAAANLQFVSSNIAALGPTDHATGTRALDLATWVPGTHVFDLTGSQLSVASTIAVHAPPGATIFINVFGGPDLNLAGQRVTLSGGVTPDDVLWNFPGVRSASFALETWVGTILIPFGTLSMSTNWVTGSVLFGGQTAHFFKDWVNFAPFHGCLPPDPGEGLPETPTALMLPASALVVFGGVVFAKRRGRRAKAAHSSP